MADTSPRPAPAGATSAFPPDREALLHDVHDEARRLALAMTTVMELLRGCDPAHPVSAGGLLFLLEPVWGGMETLSGDLSTAAGVPSFN